MVSKQLYVKLFFVLFLFIGIAKTSHSQSKISMGSLDTLSYNYYINSQWDSLFSLIPVADENNIHFYYFDYRIGIAYYMKSDFLMATYYLEKARNFYKDATADIYFAGYLYLSYVYTNQLNRAASIQNFVDPAILKVKKANRKVSALSFDYGYGKTGTYPNKLSVFSGQEYISYTKETAYSFYNAGISGQILPNLRYFSDFSLYSNSRQTTEKDEIIDSTNTDKINQYQFYLSLQYQLGKAWSISPAFHYSYMESNPLLFKYPERYPESLETDTFIYNQYAFGLDINKSYRKINFGTQLALAKLSDSTHYQAGIYLNYFPFGNLNLYSKSSLYAHFQNKQMKLIFSEKIGVKLSSKFWIEGVATIGNMNYFMDENINIVYNIADNLRGVYGLSLYYFINKNIVFKLNYRLNNLTTIRSKYTLENPEGIFTEVNYKKHLISGGLTWKF